MTLAQVESLRRLLVDPLEREHLRHDVELLVAVANAPMAAPSELADLVASFDEMSRRPQDALQLARRAYVTALLAAMDDGEVERGKLACSANVCAALAVLAGRDHEARRWLRIAEAEATADGLDGAEVLLAWWRAIEIVADEG